MGDSSSIEDNPFYRMKALWNTTPAEYVWGQLILSGVASAWSFRLVTFFFSWTDVCVCVLLSWYL